MYDRTYDLAQSNAQLEELEKLAVSAGWGRAIGAGVGALTGGAYGRSAAAPGEETGGMIRGALLGAGLGLAGGQVATGQGRRQVQRFGQRQLHGATGYLPGRGLIGRGPKGTKWYRLGEKGPKVTKEQRIKGLEKMKWTMPKGKTREEMVTKARKDIGEGTFSKHLPEKVRDFWASRRAAAGVSQRRLAEEGMTSIPGLAKGYFRGGASGKVTPLEAAKLNITAPGLLMGAGLPLAFTGQAVQDYRTHGDVKRLGADMASNIGFAAGGGLPMTAAMGLGALTGKGGELVGKGVGAVTGRTTPATPATPAPGHLVTPRGVAVAQRAVRAAADSQGY